MSSVGQQEESMSSYCAKCKIVSSISVHGPDKVTGLRLPLLALTISCSASFLWTTLLPLAPHPYHHHLPRPTPLGPISRSIQGNQTFCSLFSEVKCEFNHLKCGGAFRCGPKCFSLDQHMHSRTHTSAQTLMHT